MKRISTLLAIVPFLLMTTAAFGQTNKPDASLNLKSIEGRLGAVTSRAVDHPFLGKYLQNLNKEVVSLQGLPEATAVAIKSLDNKVSNAGRIAEDVKTLRQGSPWRTTPFICYVVPPISQMKRLPDTLPLDGKADDRIDITAAQGEFEPASFIIAPMADVKRLELKASALVGDNGKIPAGAVDIKVVKCWYQAGTAWYSYFADPASRALVPELLLNDENLVKVDMEKQENYLRVDYPKGSQYVWASYPAEAEAEPFNYQREPFVDSPVLLPVRLETGQAKQFWLTVKIPENTVAGIYNGRISLTAEGRSAGEMTLQVRVLPFKLPEPRTYYDLNRQFLTFMYSSCSLAGHLTQNGNDWKMAEQRLTAELRNMREHNLYNYYQQDLIFFDAENKKAFIRNQELVREAGFLPPLFGAFAASGGFFSPKDKSPETFDRYIEDAEEALSITERILGHRQVYFFGADEPSKRILLAQQDGWKALHEKGAAIYSTGKDSHFNLAGYAEEISNYPGLIKRENAAKWHALGHCIMSYASPHTGPENPEFSRRNHGMLLYKAWYDGSGNFQYYDRDSWNDFTGEYRRLNIVYPTQNGVIDTIAWEGFREGIDDVRYATLLKMLAEEAIATKKVDTVYAGKKALIWLELFDEKTAGLDTMRLEMINYILDLQERLAGGGA